MARLSATVRRRSDIGDDEVAVMYRLYASYYDATSAALFRSDLDAKHFVIELSDGSELRGFSTLELIDFTLAGSARRAIFSGDTIIDHRYWGEQSLAQAFCRFAGAVKAARPDLPLDWLLISKGYRTYRYLSVFARNYYPSPTAPTPPQVQACIDVLARMRFGSAYRAQLGLISYPSSHGHLKPEWAMVKAALRERAEVRHFLERNPRFHEGDELCCLTALEAGNLRSFARRAFLEGFDKPACEFHLSGAGAGGPLARRADNARQDKAV
jgi:hypothetical protein